MPAAAQRTRSVALLQCDHVPPRLRHIAGDYEQMFQSLFGAVVPKVRLLPIDVVGGEPLPPANAYDAAVVTGSRHSVGDPLDWIASLTQYVRDLADTGKPVVGICFGHQVVAAALGGTVERAAAGWGVGVHDARVVATRPWMQPPASAFRLLVSHQDQVATPPPGATVVASSDHTPVAVFEAGTSLGFQGHPEFVPAYADALLTARAPRIGADVVAHARASLATPLDRELVTTWIARFLTTG